jgi:hypothetical protein
MEWIFEETYTDILSGAWYDEFISEDGTKVKQIFDDGSIEIFDIEKDSRN